MFIFFIIYLILVLCLFLESYESVLTLGIATQFPEKKNMFEIEQFLGKRLGYREVYIPFLCTQGDFENLKSTITSIFAVQAVPIFRLDPAVQTAGNDAMLSIKLGLYDSSINSIFAFLQENITGDSQAAILIFGTGCNNPTNFWGLDPTLFVAVYQKIVSMASSYNLTDHLSFGISLDPSIYEYENVVVTDPDDPSKVINEYVRLFINPDAGQSEPKLYFPGNNFVNWITYDCLNANPDKWDWSDECIKKANALVQMVEPRKPVLAFIGTPTPKDSLLEESSAGDKDLKIKIKSNWYKRAFKQIISNMDDILVPVKGIILYNRDSNSDIGFYNSTLGDVDLGDSLYTYSILETLMTTYNANIFGDTNSIKNADPEDEKSYLISLPYTAAFSGICSAGYQSVSNECVPCEAGMYSKEADYNGCIECPIGFYNDEIGRADCKECPTGTISIAKGAKLLEYCTCKWNYYDTNDFAISGSAVPICVKCPLNQYSSGGSGECKDCPRANRHKSKDETLVGCYCKGKKVYDVIKEQCVSIDSDEYVAAQYGYLTNDDSFSTRVHSRLVFISSFIIILISIFFLINN